MEGVFGGKTMLFHGFSRIQQNQLKRHFSLVLPMVFPPGAKTPFLGVFGPLKVVFTPYQRQIFSKKGENKMHLGGHSPYFFQNRQEIAHFEGSKNP